MPPKAVKSTFKPPLANKSTSISKTTKKKATSISRRQNHDNLNDSLSECEADDADIPSDHEHFHESNNGKSNLGTAIPAQLLARLMHEHFVHKDETKIEKEAMEVFRRYIETFVMEAVARAAKENAGTGFLEVSLGM